MPTTRPSAADWLDYAADILAPLGSRCGFVDVHLSFRERAVRSGIAAALFDTLPERSLPAENVISGNAMTFLRWALSPSLFDA